MVPGHRSGRAPAQCCGSQNTRPLTRFTAYRNERRLPGSATLPGREFQKPSAHPKQPYRPAKLGPVTIGPSTTTHRRVMYGSSSGQNFPAGADVLRLPHWLRIDWCPMAMSAPKPPDHQRQRCSPRLARPGSATHPRSFWAFMEPVMAWSYHQLLRRIANIPWSAFQNQSPLLFRY